MTTSHFSVVSQVFGDFLVFEAELHDLIMAMEFALEHSWNNFGLRVILEASFKLSGTLILFLIVQAFMATLLMVLFGGRLRSFIREDFRINFRPTLKLGRQEQEITTSLIAKKTDRRIG
ncbi:transmembrane protein, putative [Medicago truncatula]|uniref:Transmembrane protein, putative n=1 Tax=Medicago truncatula TaxID=3880 RepID=G7KJG6_MEDTR|nr:transmembrane protein, putative [Medicago truncatula]